MNVENDSLLLRRMEFFHQYDIEVWLRKGVSPFSLPLVAHSTSWDFGCLLNTKFSLESTFSSGSTHNAECHFELKGLCLQAMHVDTDKKTVMFDDGTVQSYDQLLISTGCRYGHKHTRPKFDFWDPRQPTLTSEPGKCVFFLPHCENSTPDCFW